MQHNNLWAPWRVKYIQGLSRRSPCFLCDYINDPDSDRDNLVLWRAQHTMVVFNRFPYNNGHLLITPQRHIASFDEASDAEMLEMTKLIRESQKILKLAVTPHGFNTGMNFGRCAGAGLPDHMHIHVVPRWDGDTNFMHVCSDTDVISQSLLELYDRLQELSHEHSLPDV